MDETMRQFVQFMRDNDLVEMRYDGTTGMLTTVGCDGVTFGSCCSKSLDLTGVVDTVAQLIGME